MEQPLQFLHERYEFVSLRYTRHCLVAFFPTFLCCTYDMTNCARQSSVRKSSRDGRRENEFAEWVELARCIAGDPEPAVAAEANEVVESLSPAARVSAAIGTSSLHPTPVHLQMYTWPMRNDRVYARGTIAAVHGCPSPRTPNADHTVLVLSLLQHTQNVSWFKCPDELRI